MTIQSQNDWSELRSLGRIAATIRDAVARAARPSLTTRDLDTIAEGLATRDGARSAPREEYGFPGFLCLSVNDAVVHGVPDDTPLRAGDVLTVDVTVSRGGYVVDTAKTVRVSSPHRIPLTAAAEDALSAGLRELRSETRLSRVGAAISESVHQSGFHVLRRLSGHGVGRRIHEHPPVPNFEQTVDDTMAWDGLVLAVEPIITENATSIREDDDGWTLRTTNGCLAAHSEHTVVVTEGRPIVLTEPAAH